MARLTLWDILHPDALPQCEQYLAALWQHQDVGPLSLSFMSKCGATVEVEGVALVQSEQGRTVAINAFLRNVTEQRRSARTEAARFAVTRILAASPDLDVALRQVLEAIAANLNWQAAELWQTDELSQQLRRCDVWYITGHPELDVFVEASRAFTFTRREGLPGRAWVTNEVIWEHDLLASPTFRRTTLAAQAGLRTAVAVPIVQGQASTGVMLFFSRAARPLEVSLKAVLADLGEQLGQFAARKQAESDLKAERALLARRVEQRTTDLIQVNADLARALRAKDEFLANMSHELRTPLNSILALSEVLLDQFQGPLNTKQQASLRNIELSGQHLLSLINDILDLSKVEAGRLDLIIEPIAVADICEISLLFVRELALKKQLRLTFELNDQLAMIEADPKRLKQMLVNMLSNAVKFTPAHGHVILKVEALPQAGKITFAVQDTGIGISPEDQLRLFQPFTQLESDLRRMHEGTGLGLALVRRLAEIHGGSVTVASELGQGSCFTLTLPYQTPQRHPREPLPEHLTPAPAVKGSGPALITDDSEVADAQRARYLQLMDMQHAAAPGAAAALAQARILLADDNESNINVISDYLQNYGYHVVTARNGHETLAQAMAMQPDMILLDIQMPELDGLEVARRLRAEPRFAATPILALTALAMPGDRERCLEAGASEYMTKPVSLKRLVETIQRLLEL